MTRPLLRTCVVALVCLLLGWVTARAQAPSPPEFELTVSAPEGETVIECVRGCDLQWVARGLMPAEGRKPQFQYACRNSPSGRCGSGRIGGWLRRE